MPTYTHTHVGANSPTQIDLSDYGPGLLLQIQVKERAGSDTVDVDEAGGLARKLVDLSASTSTVNVIPEFEVTDNTGTGLGVYSKPYLDTPLTVTSSENCTVVIQVVR